MEQARLPVRYRLIEEVGHGGMAVVYRAQDETLKREVAIKVLHPHLLAERESKARLEREAHAVAKLRHDNILQVFDYSGGDSPAAYIVTEFIDGLTLKQFLANRKTPLPEVAALMVLEVGSALCHAHGLGIIHRDLKPENVMVRKDGMLKLMDFGIAQVLDLERMTVTGQLLGSPAYMAPEIFEGKPLDFRTDVFALGVMLYQTSTGTLPFSGRNPHEVLKRIAEGRFADPRTVNRLISDKLARIITRALAKRPDDRYPSVDALLEDLKAYVKDAGLDNPREEVRRYFVNPDGYESEVVPRMVKALVATGRRERAAQKLARALEAWNRVLALEPNNAEVARELRRLEGRRRLRNVSIAVGGTTLLAGLAWGAFELAGKEAPPPEMKMSVEATPLAPAKKPAPVHSAAKEAAATKPPVRRGLRPLRDPTGSRKGPEPSPVALPSAAETALPPAPSPPVPTKTYTLAPWPMKVTFSVDGGEPRPYGPGSQTIELTGDRPHTILFESDCCLPQERTVDPRNPGQYPGDRIPVTLKHKLTTLTVQLQPAQKDARIEIFEVGDSPEGGRVMGRYSSGEQVVVTFESGGELRKTLEVSVLKGQQVMKQKQIEIAAGNRLTQTVVLE